MNVRGVIRLATPFFLGFALLLATSCSKTEKPQPAPVNTASVDSPVASADAAAPVARPAQRSADQRVVESSPRRVATASSSPRQVATASSSRRRHSDDVSVAPVRADVAAKPQAPRAGERQHTMPRRVEIPTSQDVAVVESPVVAVETQVVAEASLEPAPRANMDEKVPATRRSRRSAEDPRTVSNASVSEPSRDPVVELGTVARAEADQAVKTMEAKTRAKATATESRAQRPRHVAMRPKKVSAADAAWQKQLADVLEATDPDAPKAATVEKEQQDATTVKSRVKKAPRRPKVALRARSLRRGDAVEKAPVEDPFEKMREEEDKGSSGMLGSIVDFVTGNDSELNREQNRVEALLTDEGSAQRRKTTCFIAPVQCANGIKDYSLACAGAKGKEPSNKLRKVALKKFDDQQADPFYPLPECVVPSVDANWEVAQGGKDACAAHSVEVGACAVVSR